MRQICLCRCDLVVVVVVVCTWSDCSRRIYIHRSPRISLVNTSPNSPQYMYTHPHLHHLRATRCMTVDKNLIFDAALWALMALPHASGMYALAYNISDINRNQGLITIGRRRVAQWCGCVKLYLDFAHIHTLYTLTNIYICFICFHHMQSNSLTDGGGPNGSRQRSHFWLRLIEKNKKLYLCGDSNAHLSTIISTTKTQFLIWFRTSDRVWW